MTHYSKLGALCVATLLFASSCSESKTESTTETVETNVDTMAQNVKEGAQDAAAAVKDAFTADSDSDFVVKATIDNNMELKLLQAGVAKGADKDLKKHATMMIADHKKLGAKVAAYAKAKGYKLPDGDDGKSTEKLADIDKSAKGKEWDKEWTDDVLDAHESAVNLFERNSDNVKDAELKAMIDEALPTLRSHRDMMKEMDERLDH
ncbi:MAG: DUF4142 domain-containing protein [Bacteroidota bacterium]